MLLTSVFLLQYATALQRHLAVKISVPLILKLLPRWSKTRDTRPRWEKGQPYYDVAVLETTAVSFGKHVRPVCLPATPDADPDRYADSAAKATGWGVYAKNEQVSDNLLKATSVQVYTQK